MLEAAKEWGIFVFIFHMHSALDAALGPSLLITLSAVSTGIPCSAQMQLATTPISVFTTTRNITFVVFPSQANQSRGQNHLWLLQSRFTGEWMPIVRVHMKDKS